MRVGVVVVVVAFLLTGCPAEVALYTATHVPGELREASRQHQVSSWIGRYPFTECAPNAPQTCWTYDIAIDDDANGTFRADGPDVALHATLRPKVEDGFLLLHFNRYIDNDPDDRPLHVFGRQAGYRGHPVLASIGHDKAGHWCLVFDAFQSPLKSRLVCAQ